MTRRILHVGLGLLLIYVLLFVQLELTQVVRADSLRDHPQNTREIGMVFDAPRGAIKTTDGETVAQTVSVSGTRPRLRQYPYGSLYSHLVGFISAHHGGDGLERSHNNFLAGRDLAVRVQDKRDFFVDRARTGQIQLSVRHDVQLVARAALAGHRGAAVVINPANGAVLAMWSSPHFDPNHLSSHDLAAVTNDVTSLKSDKESPLLNRADSQLADVGPIFAIVTAASAIEAGLDDFLAPQVDSILVETGKEPIGNNKNATCGGGLTELLVTNCRTGWATIGSALGMSELRTRAKAFGMTESVSNSTGIHLNGVIRFDDEALSAAHIAAGVGVQLSPLHLAHLFATIGNDGQRIRPRVVDQIQSHDGSVIRDFEPEYLGQVIASETASKLQTMLAANVQAGNAQGLALNEVEVGGILASASAGHPQVWAIALAPVTQPELAIAVLLEGDNLGGPQVAESVVAAITRSIIEAVLRLPTPNLEGVE
ncbi:MAG: penicillin-binding transpeptidase domain-containing protein [Acidimicrobiales bacterium]|nr:penicillin-binding transpeptidase domain-containing protein [Acidimicrobiales bacterium]